MSKEMTAFSLWQGDMHMSGKVPKEFMEKMVEISNRDPEGSWTDRGLDLLETAIKELKQNN